MKGINLLIALPQSDVRHATFNELVQLKQLDSKTKNIFNLSFAIDLNDYNEQTLNSLVTKFKTLNLKCLLSVTTTKDSFYYCVSFRKEVKRKKEHRFRFCFQMKNFIFLSGFVIW